MPAVRYDASTRWGAGRVLRSSQASVGFDTRFSGSAGSTTLPKCPMWIWPLMS